MELYLQHGCTPMHIVGETGNTEVAELLVCHAALIDPQNEVIGMDITVNSVNKLMYADVATHYCKIYTYKRVHSLSHAHTKAPCV